MTDIHRFGKIEEMGCFEDGTNNILYFPVTDSVDFPKSIRDKAEEMIYNMIHSYEAANNCCLDLSDLCLNARMIVFVDNAGHWLYEIAVVVSGHRKLYDIWMEKEYNIRYGDDLYKPFKAYFMKQLEKTLFWG